VAPDSLLAAGALGATRGVLKIPPFLEGVALMSADSFFDLLPFRFSFPFGFSSFDFSSFCFSSFGSAGARLGVSFGS
jgi:hypothetical protein